MGRIRHYRGEAAQLRSRTAHRWTDRHRRRPEYPGVLALYRSRHPRDRQARRCGESRASRCSPFRPASSCRRRTIWSPPSPRCAPPAPSCGWRRPARSVRMILYNAQGGSLKDWQQSQVDLATAQGGLDSANIALGAVRGRLRILGKTDAEIAALEEHPEHATASPEVEVGAPIGGTDHPAPDRRGPEHHQRHPAAPPAPSTPSAISPRSGSSPTCGRPSAGRSISATKCSVRVLAFPDRYFNARISYVGPSIDPNTRRLPVRAEIENADFALKPQMFASFTILTGAATVVARRARARRRLSKARRRMSGSPMKPTKHWNCARCVPALRRTVWSRSSRG